jgi:hypothetical protein
VYDVAGGGGGCNKGISLKQQCHFTTRLDGFMTPQKRLTLQVPSRLALTCLVWWTGSLSTCVQSGNDPAAPHEQLSVFNLGLCNKVIVLLTSSIRPPMMESGPLLCHGTPTFLIAYTASCTRCRTQPRADPIKVLFASELGLVSTTPVVARISHSSEWNLTCRIPLARAQRPNVNRHEQRWRSESGPRHEVNEAIFSNRGNLARTFTRYSLRGKLPSLWIYQSTKCE